MRKLKSFINLFFVRSLCAFVLPVHFSTNFCNMLDNYETKSNYFLPVAATFVVAIIDFQQHLPCEAPDRNISNALYYVFCLYH